MAAIKIIESCHVCSIQIPVEFNQHLLFPSNIFDLLAEDHECYLYTDLFQQLDTAVVESSWPECLFIPG